MPIQLIKEFNLSFVGQDTRLGSHPAYAFGGEFCGINNYFRVSRTKLAKKISENAGFCRFRHQKRTGLKFANVGWKIPKADNGVVANWWSDRMQMGNKLGWRSIKFWG